MSSGYYYGIICFASLNKNSPIFSFSEFLTGLAFMVIIWTIADVRYGFRVRIAPLPLQEITFPMIGAVGFLTLLTDLCRAEQWLVPQIKYLTQWEWQAFLAGLFLFTFMIWVWFAFIHPPVYGRYNAKRYAQALFQAILKGAHSELSVIADEFARSAKSLLRYATTSKDINELLRRRHADNNAPPSNKKIPEVTAYADDILRLIGDKRFCRAIVESSPGTALAIFRAIEEAEQYGIPQLKTFARNIVNEALVNKDSFLFHETDEYESGLIGYHKPLSQAIFSNHKMVDGIGTLLDQDPSIWGREKWDAVQCRAYCRIVLMTFRDYVEKDNFNHYSVLYRANRCIISSIADLYKINGVTGVSLNDDVLNRLRAVIDFIKKSIEILEEKGVPKHLRLRVREKHGRKSSYDHLANMIFEVIYYASMVRSPDQLCYFVQYDFIWNEIFSSDGLNGMAAKIVKFKVRRLIYDDVTMIKNFTGFKGAKILRFCLNVMGFDVPDRKTYFKDRKALHKAIMSWTKKNYAGLYSYNRQLAEACLPDGMTYDEEKMQLVKTYPAGGLRRETQHVYFSVKSPSSLHD